MNDAMRALENLTPGGSEYVGDIKRCVEFIKRRQSSQHQRTISLAKRITLLTRQIQEFEVRDLLAEKLVEKLAKATKVEDRGMGRSTFHISDLDLKECCEQARQLLGLYQEEEA